MARARTAFFCRECGNESARWQGRCPGCNEWNTLVEEPAAPRRPSATARGNGRHPAPAAEAVRLRDVRGAEDTRWSSGIAEFDHVLGGGVVPGSVVLVGGEPGIGKSTLLLQVAARLETAGRPTLYASGEESALQVRLRADRLDEGAGEVTVLAETDLGALLARASERQPAVLLVDSIQTVHTPELEGAPGSVGQVRECAARLQRWAKDTGTAVFLVGHVTKGGGIAGPKTLEHIVDTVLYFETAGGLDSRVLRATKNRFGGVDEIGVFRMTATGLEPVANPSALFMGDRERAASGSAVVATMEGTRPLLVEVQALATRAPYGSPQRVSTGIDHKRLALLLAVMEKRAGLAFGQFDVFLNAVGGLRIVETAADAAVAAALASSVFDRPVPADAMFIGELGLAGELRPVGQVERRLAEAARMGFRTAYLSPRAVPERLPAGLKAVPIHDVRGLIDHVFH
jgi:DNA repair protein RadA/Sms